MNAHQLSTRYSTIVMQNAVLIADDLARRIVDNFPRDQEDAAASYVADLNNGDVEDMPS